MMDRSALQTLLRQKVSHEVDVEEEGLNRYVVYTPFRFDDGDHYVVTLHRNNGSWLLSDEGQTFLHLSYGDSDFTRGARAAFVEESLSKHGLRNSEGELLLEVPGDAFGDALFSFVQGIAQVTTVRAWTHRRVRSTFLDDFRSLMTEVIPEPLRRFQYNDPDLDPEAIYPVDCFVATPRPCHIYAVGSDAKCKDATISILHYERAGKDFTSLALFEDQARVNGRAVAQLTDVVDKQYSSLAARDKIQHYIQDHVLQLVA